MTKRPIKSHDVEAACEQIVLEEVKGTAVVNIPIDTMPKLYNVADFRACIIDEWHQLQLMLTVRYKGEALQKTRHTVMSKWPATWWQMLKHQHAPQWFLSRWPVVWQEEHHNVTFKRNAVYPQLPLKYRGLEPKNVETFQYMSHRPEPRIASDAC